MMRVSRPPMRGNTALAHAYDFEEEPEPELVDNVIPIGQRRTLLELTEDTCRWPIGDPGSADFFFCGGQPVTSLPYCAYHSRVAYQPAQPAPRPAPAVPRLMPFVERASAWLLPTYASPEALSRSSRTGRRARSRRRERCGSGRARGRG